MKDVTSTGQNQSYRVNTNSAEPREAGPIGKAKETLGYLNELDSLMSNFRHALYGPSPELKGEAGRSMDKEPSLEEMLIVICQRSAMAVGEMKSLFSRLD